ncbi:uncharacterized protein LOC116177118 [Photinus pyralis]|nr:uncharacterized protein LOC116159913 [Photinus pyralis]XP_031329142.1 uncharacterized protein LOC116160144 [Photinus pyralis]XP_031329220.1 uncharacterized protein LOC116160213 [Photinus pyralis]XP_031333496.1 uncharacterized protein LOC116163613 [Photinus pyralis]XP_031333589.1 uncharacterized protein LOC116163670 [Photinus pyralis]XP_031335042.1 uncharacterized protein LOC116164920 [Photinus pyralis]XP_031341787.1 uncharacterized protein LOC116169762 [Photinus pyralis]XP_031351852.1 unc
MDDDVQISAAAFIILCDAIKKKQRKRRRYWMTNLFKSRNIYSGSNLLNDLSLSRTGQFKNFCRISCEDFEYLIHLIGHKIAKQETTFRQPIPVKERLAVTLRFLATGDSYTSLMYLFKISKQSISTIVTEVCQALCDALKDYVKMPSTIEEWTQTSKIFEDVWHFPHCLAALDGKHIMLQAPIQSGSEYYNYKSFHSIVLLALVDGQYNFLFCDVGGQGRISDGGIFKNSLLWRKIEKRELPIPEPRILPGRQKRIPYVFVADDAFALHDNIMKPYSGLHDKGTPERIFNYRLSRARRIVENAFGILSAVFRVLRKPLLLEPEKARLVVLTTLYLHNFLRSGNSNQIYTPPGTFDSEEDGLLIEGTWRRDGNPENSFLPIRRLPRKSPLNAQQIRNELAEYFSSNGAVSFQDKYA